MRIKQLESPKKQLNEGVIDVPESLVDYALNIVMKYVGNYIGNSFDRKYHDHFVVNKRYVANTIGKYEFSVNEGEAIGNEYDIDVSEVKYTDLNVDALIIGIHTNNDNSMYLPDQNAMFISTKRIFKIIDQSNTKAERPEEQDDYYELAGTFDTINKALAKFFASERGIIKHELAHFIQFRYLKKKHPKQSEVDYDDYNSGIVEYLSSNIEFSPQLITAIEIFKHNIALPGDVDAKEYFKYLVGMKDTGSLVAADGAIDDKSVRYFFKALDRTDDAKYKKAIKYFINNI